MAHLFNKEAKARGYGFTSTENLAAANNTFKSGGLLDQGELDALKAAFGLDGPYSLIPRWRGIARRGEFGGVFCW